ncbi:fimbrial protein [Burkholderia contaminans]|uniref:fimbrial protein n=1 Tax=Burkholderia contaminans TaxID=488447 RepID=UPI00158B8AB1|nr:fimbrial protein [Burkholderia contaminans]
MSVRKGLVMMAAILLLPSLVQAAPYCGVTYPQVGMELASDYYYDANKVPPFNPNVANGTLLSQVTLMSTNKPPLKRFKCAYPVYHLAYWQSNLPLASGFGKNMYQSGVEGVGVQIVRQDGQLFPIFLSNALYPDYDGGTGGNSLSIKLNFYKIGPITGRGSLTGEFAFHAVNSTTDKIISYRWSGDLQIKAPTCAASAGTQNVELGTYPAKRFNGIGSVSDLKPFVINLSCSGGDDNVQTKLYMTLTDNTKPTNTSNTLSLAPDSVAKGLGVQVFKDSMLLGYGPDSAAAGNTNQWHAGTTGNGFFSIPLSARFIQTEQTVTGGAAKARMTFTISYQ